MNKQYPDENKLLCFLDGEELGLNRELVWEWNQIVLQKRFCNTPVGFSSEMSKEHAIDAEEDGGNISKVAGV